MINQTTDPNLLRGKLCPFLGLEDDRETSLAYPSMHNCCFHAKPVVAVNLIKQRQYCISINYNTCPIYTNEIITKLPEGWGYRKLMRLQPQAWLLFALIAFVVVAAILVSILLGLFERPRFIDIPQNSTVPTTMVNFPSPTTEPLIIVPLVTEIPEPTSTEFIIQPTAISPHMLETPFRNNPQILFHQLQQGDGFIMLAEKYATSVDAIKAINYGLTDTLLVNKIIIIPLNTTDVSNVPPFSLYKEESGGVAIEELANRMNLDAASLRTYNDLPEGYTVSQGEWLLIPR